MVFYKCAVCHRRIPSNRVKARVGAPTRWTQIKKYGRENNLFFQKTDLLCGRCDAEFSLKFRRTGFTPSLIPSVSQQNSVNDFAPNLDDPQDFDLRLSPPIVNELQDQLENNSINEAEYEESLTSDDSQTSSSSSSNCSYTQLSQPAFSPGFSDQETIFSPEGSQVESQDYNFMCESQYSNSSVFEETVTSTLSPQKPLGILNKL